MTTRRCHNADMVSYAIIQDDPAGVVVRATLPDGSVESECFFDSETEARSWITRQNIEDASRIEAPTRKNAPRTARRLALP